MQYRIIQSCARLALFTHCRFHPLCKEETSNTSNDSHNKSTDLCSGTSTSIWSRRVCRDSGASAIDWNSLVWSSVAGSWAGVDWCWSRSSIHWSWSWSSIHWCWSRGGVDWNWCCGGAFGFGLGDGDGLCCALFGGVHWERSGARVDCCGAVDWRWGAVDCGGAIDWDDGAVDWHGRAVDWDWGAAVDWDWGAAVDWGCAGVLVAWGLFSFVSFSCGIVVIREDQKRERKRRTDASTGEIGLLL